MTPWFFKCSIKGPARPPLKENKAMTRKKKGEDGGKGARLLELFTPNNTDTHKKRRVEIKAAMFKTLCNVARCGSART